MYRVLIVEDESIIAFDLELFISSLGFDVVGCCDNSNCAWEYINKNSVNIIVMDIQIKGDINGIELAQTIKKKYDKIEIIFITANLNDRNIKGAMQSNPLALLEKPYNPTELKATLKIAENRLVTTST